MKILKLLFILFFVIPSFGQIADYESLGTEIQSAMEEAELPGLAVGIIKNGEIVFSKGFGYRDARSKSPVTPETVFGVASVSKAFTATALGILAGEGKIKWTDKVKVYLPDFQLHDTFVTNEMMIVDLLCHRSGLATFDGDLLWYGTNYSREEVVHRIRHLPLKNNFRADYGYQNVMYIAAGEVIEAVSGMSWDKFIEEKIFKPLNMNSSNTTTSTFKLEDNFAVPHVNGKAQEWIDYDNSGPAASINSSVNDLLNWLQMWLNRGGFNGKDILTKKNYDFITSAHTILATGSGEEIGPTIFSTYGLGWRIYDYHGRKIIRHSGGLPGVHTMVAFIPSEEIGIVILSNQINGLINSLLTRIIDLHLPGEDDPKILSEGIERFNSYIKRENKEHEEWETKGINEGSQLLPLENYAGRYEDKMYGPAEIEIKNNELFLTLIPTDELFSGKLEHYKYNTFRIKFNDPFLPYGYVNFDLKDDVTVKGFSIDLPNPDFHFYNLYFEK